MFSKFDWCEIQAVLVRKTFVSHSYIECPAEGDCIRVVTGRAWARSRIHGGLHLHCRRRGSSVASEDGFRSESLDRSQLLHLRALCYASIILRSVPYYSCIAYARRNDCLKELLHVRV
jgi:hypothetical protein